MNGSFQILGRQLPHIETIDGDTVFRPLPQDLLRHLLRQFHAPKMGIAEYLDQQRPNMVGLVQQCLLGQIRCLLVMAKEKMIKGLKLRNQRIQGSSGLSCFARASCSSAGLDSPRYVRAKPAASVKLSPDLD